VETLEQRWLELSLDTYILFSAEHVSLSIICLFVLTKNKKSFNLHKTKKKKEKVQKDKTK
jgi:hypothetical protein